VLGLWKDFFDDEILKIAQECFDVKLMWDPSLLRYDSLEKIEYAKSLPQSLMFVAALHTDTAEYSQYNIRKMVLIMKVIEVVSKD